MTDNAFHRPAEACSSSSNILYTTRHLCESFTLPNQIQRTEPSRTPPWAIVNIICIISISWCSYRDQRSVRGQAGVHGMLQNAVRSTEYCNISALLKCKYHVVRAKRESVTVQVYSQRGGHRGRECSESSQPSPSVRVISLPWSPTTQIPPC